MTSRFQLPTLLPARLMSLELLSLYSRLSTESIHAQSSRLALLHTFEYGTRFISFTAPKVYSDITFYRVRNGENENLIANTFACKRLEYLLVGFAQGRFPGLLHNTNRADSPTQLPLRRTTILLSHLMPNSQNI